MSRDTRYKYVYWYANGYEELFDMIMDPQELVNLLEVEGFTHQAYKELRKLAIEHEKCWGPEWTVDHGELAKISVEHEVEVFDCVKYTKGLNKHFQDFNESDRETRGKRFRKELEYALHNPSVSTVSLGEIFGGEGIMEDFMEKWQEYGGCVPIEDIFGVK